MMAPMSFATFLKMAWMKRSKALFIKSTCRYTFIVVVRKARFIGKIKVENNRLRASA